MDPATLTNSTLVEEKNLGTDGAPPLAPYETGVVDSWVVSSPASGGSGVEVAANITRIDPDAGLDTLPLDRLPAIHNLGTSSIVRVTDQFQDMQTATQDHLTEKKENSSLENTFLPMFVPPSPVFSPGSLDDKTTQAAALSSISGINLHTTTSPSIPGGPTSISGFLATTKIVDGNLEVMEAAVGTELFIANPTPTAVSTNKTDLLSAPENSKYFDGSTESQFAELTGNLSKVTHSISAKNGSELNLEGDISLENGKVSGDMVVVLPTVVVNASTKKPELQIQQQQQQIQQQQEATGEKAEFGPNGENGANSTSPFWVWPTADDPWIWL